MNDFNKRIPSLDGLRAISIILVIISHVSFTSFNFENYYLMGNLGVRIFFAISGFLITSILVNEFNKEEHFDLKRFYFRRIFRIFPAYIFFLLIIMIFFTPSGLIAITDFIPAFTYTTNYFYSKLPVELGHTWSLAVEEQFYLIFPIILAFSGLKNFRKFLLAIVVITPILRFISVYTNSFYGDNQFYSLAWNFHTTMDILASGCLFAICRDRMHQNKIYSKFLASHFAIVFLLPVIVFIGYFSESYPTLFYVLGITLMNLSIILCIDWLIVNETSMFGKILNSKPLRFIGVLSYSIYLWQQPFTFYSEVKPWTYFPYNFILLAVFSLFTYYCVELKFLNLRPKIEKLWFSKKHSENILQPDSV